MLEGFSSTGSTLQRPPTILRSYLPNQMCWAVRNPSTGPSSTRWFRTLPLAWARWNLMRCGDEWSLAISLSLIHCSTDILWYPCCFPMFPTLSLSIVFTDVLNTIWFEYNVLCPGEWLEIFELARWLHRLGHAAKLWLLRGALFHLLAQWTTKVALAALAALGRWSNLVF